MFIGEAMKFLSFRKKLAALFCAFTVCLLLCSCSSQTNENAFLDQLISDLSTSYLGTGEPTTISETTEQSTDSTEDDSGTSESASSDETEAPEEDFLKITGVITEVNDKTFVLKTEDGQNLTLSYDEATRYDKAEVNETAAVLYRDDYAAAIDILRSF